MRRRTKILTAAISVAFVATIFFLPVVPVKVDPFCLACGGSLHIEELGYSSVGLYFFNYGGIYMAAGLPNFPSPLYLGYCVIYGDPLHTSCGLGINVSK